jgi:hypothetical protein
MLGKHTNSRCVWRARDETLTPSLSIPFDAMIVCYTIEVIYHSPQQGTGHLSRYCLAGMRSNTIRLKSSYHLGILTSMLTVSQLTRASGASSALP